MKFTWRSALWIAPSALVVLLLLLGAAADAWLETSGGRQLLQRELSKSLGLPVRLEGDFHFTLIPRLKIVGTRLTLGAPADGAVWASSEDYSAAVELIPFILGELRIAAVELDGGAVDADKLQRGFSAGAVPAGDGTVVLPQLGSLDITDIFISSGAKGSGVMLDHLQLRGFQPGHAAGLLLEAALVEEGVKEAQVTLDGEVTVMPGSLATLLHIRELHGELAGQRISGLTGQWQWNYSEEMLAGDMSWSQDSLEANWSLELDTGKPASGTLQGSLDAQGLLGPLKLSIEFAVLPSRIDLTHVDMALSGQELAGAGCVLLEQPAALHLVLSTEELDLDPLADILARSEGDDADLPMGLAILVRAERVRLAGALASDVVVEIGSRPDCEMPPGLDP
jgi:hypothetical protein